jgi:hypothetical protein
VTSLKVEFVKVHLVAVIIDVYAELEVMPPAKPFLLSSHTRISYNLLGILLLSGRQTS